MQIVSILIEGKRLELFDNENIEINSSVQNIRDVSKVFSDFSKSFTVPASKNNNLIFKHYYKADITGGFDARTKKRAVITVNNITYKIGKIRLESIELKQGIATHYKLTFFGDVVKIKDLLGDDTLRGLDYLDNLNHDYTSDNVKQGLTSGLDLLPSYNKSVIYPLLSPKRRFIYNSGADDTDTDTIVNIAPVNDNALDYRDLKPAVRLIHIIEAIEDKYNLTFTRDFFGRSEFTNAYIWLNRDSGLLNTRSESVNNLIDWSNGDNGFIDFNTDTLTLDLVNPTNRPSDNLQFSIFITPEVGFETVPYTVKVVDDNDGLLYERTGLTGTQQLDGGFWNPNEGTTRTLSLKYYLNPEGVFQYVAIIKNRFNKLSDNSGVSTLEETGTAVLSYGAELIVKNQMPDLKCFDFLKGLLNAFNLVAVANDDGSIYINTLKDWYSQGQIFDITKYTDTDKTTIKKGELFNRFLFNYKEPKSFLALQYLENNQIAYGDLEATLFDNDGQILDGKELKIELPFEQMVYERLTNNSTGNLTTIQYGFYVNKEQTPTVGAPLIFYNNVVQIASNFIAFRDEDNNITELQDVINIPNHAINTTDIPNYSLAWGKELSTYNFNLIENGLYRNYWEEYITDIFSEQRRVYTLECYLPLSIQRNIKLNDRLVIADRRYLINNIKTNLLTSKTSLELVNDIYSGLSADDLENDLQIIPGESVVNNMVNEFTIYIQAKDTTSITVVDSGFGIFTTIDKNALKDNGTITVTTEENIRELRTQTIRFKNNDKDYDFSLVQLANPNQFTADTTLYTADTTEITADIE